MKFQSALFFALLICLSSKSQNRLELLETNVAQKNIGPYTDSYLRTKNAWLADGMLVETSRGGNALAASSKLDKNKIDSLSTLFRKYLPTQLIRFGNMAPRINYLNDPKKPPYILSTVFEINGQEVKTLGQFKIVFAASKHNNMPDVMDIEIVPVKKRKPYTKNAVIRTFNRSATTEEEEMIPTPVRQ
jgi:hypothetical protein